MRREREKEDKRAQAPVSSQALTPFYVTRQKGQHRHESTNAELDLQRCVQGAASTARHAKNRQKRTNLETHSRQTWLQICVQGVTTMKLCSNVSDGINHGLSAHLFHFPHKRSVSFIVQTVSKDQAAAFHWV